MDTPFCGSRCSYSRTVKFAACFTLTLLVLLVVGFCNGITLPISTSGSDGLLIPDNPQKRFGLGVIHNSAQTGDLLNRTGAAWYLNWTTDPDIQTDARFWPMLRVRADGSYFPSGQKLQKAVETNPGAIWIIGNEPDIAAQDNTSPLAFAIAFHDARKAILKWDKTARFAIGAVGTVSPLRLAYLDVTLAIYHQRYGHKMPVDVWTIHHYILPEDAESWGIGVPAGFRVENGNLYLSDEHDSIRQFQQGIIAFRWWMAARGFRDKPLVVTESGLLLPGIHPQETARYLRKIVSFLLKAQDENTGYPADNAHLVQGFAWFALYDTIFETGTLLYPNSNRLTPAGWQWRKLFHEVKE